MANYENSLTALSDAMAQAVESASAWTVRVDARRRFPATGIGYAPDLVLTADHVVERDEEIRVSLPDGTELSASVAGRDPGNDLAVLRLESAAAVAASKTEKAARVGHIALALGRPTSEGMQASLGIVSATGGPVRTRRGGLLESFLRTDAIPYPGFSGGPLVDAGGHLLGVNTSGLGVGASLAIPAAVAWRVAASLAEHGSVKRGFLGIRSQLVDIPEDVKAALGRAQDQGLLIIGVEENSPASTGGLMVGDILVGMAGHAVEDHDALFAQLTGEVVGSPSAVEVLRGGKPHSIEVTAGEREEVRRQHGPRGRRFWRGHHP